MPRDLIIFCDGASRGNPGPGAVGVLIQDAQANIVREVSERLDGAMTNNEAEYRALLKALWHARDLVGESVEVRLDSKLVVEQVSGRWACNAPALQALCDRARRCVAAFPNCQLVWVPREKNDWADRLASQALDAGQAPDAEDDPPATEPAPFDQLLANYNHMVRQLYLTEQDLKAALAENRSLEDQFNRLQKRYAALEAEALGARLERVG